ncbi:pentatricopeptide repeat-containing protein At4g22760-like [Rutidosis leptorrhynchoides]|uniref:pentatricopeptide repeat-containing protein At4g22760-like n=1 Tax=Rutidosis leptorrhynchoides TaxID=125765 RepID=UPI003A9A10EE
MIFKLRNPFKPSKLDRISMLVSKVTALLNLSLTIKQVNQLHALILVNGLNHLEPIIITKIINTRSNHSEASIRYLKSLVHHSKYPNVATQTSFVQFLYQHGEFQDAVREYARVHRSGMLPCSSTIVSAIQACTRLRNRISGIMIHGHVHGYGLCGDVHVGTALVGFYSKINDVETEQKVFDEMSERNAASHVIDEFLESGNSIMAEQLFSVMGYKDVACCNSMVSWYTKKGDMEKAIATFGPMLVKTSPSWTAMITGYVDSGNMEIARNFYDVMPEQDVVSCMKMIDGYSKNGAVESAREIFNEMDEKGHSLYDAMITCYAQNDRLKDALQLFDEMIQSNVNIRPDNKTLATIISICTQWGNLSFGLWIHETLMKQMGITMDDELGTALIELYAKCGRVDKAYGLFCGLQKKDVGVYTTMILACSRNGWKYDAVKLFEEMLEANICPNLVTFSGLLTALNHVGWTEAGYPRSFKS